MVLGERRGQWHMTERTTQRRYRQREREKEDQQPVESPRHGEKSTADTRKQSS
jgi:hypothetical protein